MPTYKNPETGVVHWLVGRVSFDPRPYPHAVCHFSDRFRSWDWKNFDRLGAPEDVTCCKCRETAAWLDAAQDAAEAEKGESGMGQLINLQKKSRKRSRRAGKKRNLSRKTLRKKRLRKDDKVKG